MPVVGGSDARVDHSSSEVEDLSLMLNNTAPREAQPEEDDEILSLGLAYQSDLMPSQPSGTSGAFLGREAEESQVAVFRKPVTQECSQKPQTTLLQFAERRKAIEIIDVDGLEPILVPSNSSEIADPIRPISPDVSSVAEPESSPVGLPVVRKPSPKKKISRKKPSPKKALVIQAEEESEFALATPDPSQELGLVGTTHSTRRRARIAQNMVGREMERRSEGAVFRALAEQAERVAKTPPSGQGRKRLQKRQENDAVEVQEEKEEELQVEGDDYSMIPESQIGNAHIYDLSQASELVVTTQTQKPGRQILAATQSLDVNVDNVDNITPGAPEAPEKKRTKREPSKVARRVVLSSSAGASEHSVNGEGHNWIRGRINNHNVQFAEPRNREKVFGSFQCLVTGCKVVNELDSPEKHIRYMVSVDSGQQGVEPKKVVLADWIHDIIVSQGGRELMQNSMETTAFTSQRRLASILEPVAGTPFKHNVICISEKPHRTIKWLLAVAAGIPVVRWKWLHECVRNKRLMDYRPFLLRIGYSLSRDRMLPYQERPATSRLAFDGRKVEIVGPPQWRDMWTAVLKELGAEVVERLHIGNEKSLDFVLSDEDEVYPPDLVLQKARILKIPVVSREFIIQCTLSNTILSVRSDASYKAKRHDQ